MSEAQRTLCCGLIRRGPLAVAQTIIIVTVDQARPSVTSGFECHTASIAAATSAPATFRFKDAHLYHYYNHGPRYIIHNGLCNLSVFILPYGSRPNSIQSLIWIPVVLSRWDCVNCGHKCHCIPYQQFRCIQCPHAVCLLAYRVGHAGVVPKYVFLHRSM
jgi:hypothetical protein